jgi:AcrR family transcriptional regulator
MARPRSDIQARVVEAARARFLTDGVDGASLREIAREAGTNLGMIVYYFPSKDDLFLAVIEPIYAKILADVGAALRAHTTARDRLRAAVIRLGSVSDQELEVIRLVAREALLSSSRFQHVLTRFMRGHVPLIVATIADGVRDGEFDGTVPAPILLIAVMGLGGLPQLIRRAMQGTPLFSTLPAPADLADDTLALLFRAVSPRGHGTTTSTATKNERTRRASRAKPPARKRKGR